MAANPTISSSSDLYDLSPQEIVELAAADSLFYSRHFFPKVFRQDSPRAHQKVWYYLDSPDPEHAQVGLEMFRGSGKTTICRTNVSKRVAYGISRTILFTSASQDHAARSVRWVKRQVEVNTYWAQTFGLRKGPKWTDTEIEIINEALGISTFVVAVGISGQIRGLNLEDYRPDFIIVDDPCDEENTGTEEQRAKTSNLFFGSLAPGLAPRSESPFAKMALLQTGLHKQDLINTCHEDPAWTTVKFPIFNEDKDGNKESAWPERWTTEELLEKRENYFAMGRGHMWLREMECQIVAPEEAPFKLEWLKYYDFLPERMVVFAGIDPAREKASKPHKTCIVFIGVAGNDVYLLDYFQQSGLNPEEIWGAYYSMAMRWRPANTGIETIAYQQTLKWYFEKKMREVGTFFQTLPIEDRRKKGDRILQEITGPAHAGNLYVKADQHEWIDYYRDWRYGTDIDLLDATALAFITANPALMMANAEDGYGLAYMTEDHIPEMEIDREFLCP